MQKTLLPSSSAAAFDGPNARRPASCIASTKPSGERRFGADDRQINCVVFGELHEPHDVGGWDVDVLGIERGAGVARGDENSLGTRTLGDLPCQRMFAATISYYQNFHVFCRIAVAEGENRHE